MGKEAVEFRGVDNLVYAEVITDTSEEIVFGPVKVLAPVAEIARTVSGDKATKYYDNAPRITIKANGAHEVTITSAVIDLPTLADITGQSFDEEVQMLTDADADGRYFAIGYRTKDTSGAYRYVWRLKGQFSEPGEASHTEDDGTDGKGQELVYTGLSTVHVFEKYGKNSKAVVVQENENVDFSTWFDAVQTPDTVKPKQASAPPVQKAKPADK